MRKIVKKLLWRQKDVLVHGEALLLVNLITFLRLLVVARLAEDEGHNDVIRYFILYT